MRIPVGIADSLMIDINQILSSSGLFVYFLPKSNTSFGYKEVFVVLPA